MSDHNTAFDALEARAAQDAQRAPLDRISLRDYLVDVEIGAFQSERDITQRLSFSVVVEVAPSNGALSDDVDDIMSYDAISDAINAALAFERLNLLETLAERIASLILQSPQALVVYLRVEKLDRGPGDLGVEIVRRREALRGQGEMVELPPASVLYLPKSLWGSNDFSAFLARLSARDGAVILCLGDQENIEGGTGASRRISLLNHDINAWKLAENHLDCVPVATRTELDWGVNNGQISVWAPTKLVIDGVDAPETTQMQELCGWFARKINARELLFVDTDLTENGGDLMRKISAKDDF